jgi:hypothetical protein
MALARLVVHLLSQINDLAQTIGRQVFAIAHHLTDAGKRLERRTLAWGVQRIFTEERKYFVYQINMAVDFKVIHAVPSLSDGAALKRLSQQIQDLSFFLRHVEAGTYPPAKRSIVHLLDTDVEASFTIHKPGKVMSNSTLLLTHDVGPFLLVVCTEHVVTCSCGQVVSDSQGFQHMAKFISVTTTVLFIVTAAVHRGFGSRLRLAADPSP